MALHGRCAIDSGKIDLIIDLPLTFFEEHYSIVDDAHHRRWIVQEMGTLVHVDYGLTGC